MQDVASDVVAPLFRRQHFGGICVHLNKPRLEIPAATDIEPALFLLLDQLRFECGLSAMT
jgi:hypothetical protein